MGNRSTLKLINKKKKKKHVLISDGQNVCTSALLTLHKTLLAFLTNGNTG